MALLAVAVPIVADENSGAADITITIKMGDHMQGESGWGDDRVFTISGTLKATTIDNTGVLHLEEETYGTRYEFLSKMDDGYKQTGWYINGVRWEDDADPEDYTIPDGAVFEVRAAMEITSVEDLLKEVAKGEHHSSGVLIDLVITEVITVPDGFKLKFLEGSKITIAAGGQLVLESESSLTIAEGSTLIIKGSVINEGSFVNNGAIIKQGGTLEGEDSITGTGTIKTQSDRSDDNDDETGQTDSSKDVDISVAFAVGAVAALLILLMLLLSRSDHK